METLARDFLIASGAVALGSYFYFLQKKSTKQDPFITVEILAPEDFKKVCREIRRMYSSKYWPAYNTCREERRKFPSKTIEYENIVISFNNKNKNLIEETRSTVLRKYWVSEKVFEDSVNYYDSDNGLREYAENLVTPLYNDDHSSSLTREQTIEILNYFNERYQEFHDIIEINDYTVLIKRLEDEVFEKFKVEMDQVNSAYEKFKDAQLEEIVEPMKCHTSYILASADDSFEFYNT